MAADTRKLRDRCGDVEDPLALLDGDGLSEVVGHLPGPGDGGERRAYRSGRSTYDLEQRDVALHPAVEPGHEVDDELTPRDIASEVGRVVLSLEVPLLTVTVLNAELAHGALPSAVTLVSQAWRGSDQASGCERGASAAEHAGTPPGCRVIVGGVDLRGAGMKLVGR